MSFQIPCLQSNIENFNRKHKSNCADPTNSLQQSSLEQKLSTLENQYVQMEMEYSKKIKQLKANLAEKTRRQTSLMTEITNLRNIFKTHQEEITKVGEQLADQELRQTELKQSKKNSSPGLIKKSLENDRKYQKKQSPTAHQDSKQLGKLFGQVKKTQFGGNSSPGIKRRSPRGNPNGILHLLKQDPQVNLGQQKDKKATEAHSGKKQPQKTSGDAKKKAYSPKNIQQTKILIQNIAKNVRKEGNSSPTNGSPRRPIRRSPGEKGGVFKIEQKKESKQLLGNLKQNADIEEVF